MDAREAEALVERSPAAIEASWSTAWKVCLSVLSISLAALVLVYFDTFRSMVAIWSRSDTYVHGYFVLPISLYLIWTRRAEVRRLAPRPDAAALVPMVLAGLGWLAARLGGVLVAEQYFAVASIPMMAWALAGRTVVRRLLFPLGYLLLMVPVGEALIPHLIDYTAAFTVAALRFSGVPVLQEGNLLTLPNSQWSVVEACSGLRYLIACVTIGLVFAYLTYRSWTRRALFIGLSVAVPIVANWIRAFLIVFVGYSSGMTLAVGVDHLIYGWIFYALVMCLLLWVGSRFSDDKAPEKPEAPLESAGARPTPVPRTVSVACAAVLAAAIWPVWAGFTESSVGGVASSVELSFPEKAGEWTYAGGRSPFEPHYVGASFAGVGVYESGDSRVGLHVALYLNQRQGEELVSSANSLVPEADGWHQLSLEGREVSLPGGRHSVEEAILNGPGGRLLVWRWYWIGGRHTSSPVWAKAIESSEKLLFQRPPAAGIVVFTDAGDEDQARARLEAFLTEGLPAIESALEEASR
ncbi:MAG TPA: exosortase A [Vicinamibacteria bacterium]